VTVKGRKQGWPATLTEPDLLDAPVVLRPIRLSDARTFRETKVRNASWLRPWEPSDPEAPVARSPIGKHISMVGESPIGTYVSLVRVRLEAIGGFAFPWVICYGGQFAGQVTVWSIMRGPSRSAELAYWIDEKFAGRGIMPTAVAMVVDHCFGAMRMHRLEAGIRSENVASRRVVEKLGFRHEGTRVRVVHYDGAWRDHIFYAITAEEVSAGMLPQWRNSLAASARRQMI
jgi:[ribosomal protein S5]-alanine N-acetyltransferase